MSVGSWILNVFGIRTLTQAFVPTPDEPNLEIDPAFFTVTWDGPNERNILTSSGGSTATTDVKIQAGAPAQELIGLYSGATLIGTLFTWTGSSSGQTIWNAGQAFVPVIQGFVNGVQYTVNSTHAFTGGLTLTGDADVTGSLILEPEVTPAAPTTSGANKFFSRSSDGHACIRNSAGVVTDLEGSAPAAGFLVVLVTLTAGSGTAASGKTLTNAKIVGVYLTTASAAVGSPAPSISGNNVVITSYGPGASSLITDASTYAVVLVGWV